MSVEHGPIAPVAVSATGASPRISGRTWTCLILFAAGWLLAFGWWWLADKNGIGFGPFGTAVFRSLFVVAALLSVPLVLRACWRRRWVVGGLTVSLVAALGIAGGSLWSEQDNVAAWYQLHRSDYLAISRLAGTGALGQASGSSLSVTGHVVTLGTNSGKPIVYLPVWTGIPDCSEGYAWFSGPIEPRYTAPDAESKDRLDDTFGCPVRPLQSVGDGWWYVA